MTISVTKAMRLNSGLWRNGLVRSQKIIDSGAPAGTGMGDKAKRKESVAFERVRGKPDSIHVAYLQGDPAHCQPPSTLLQDSILLEIRYIEQKRIVIKMHDPQLSIYYY